MRSPPGFWRLVARAVFVVLSATILVLPGLTSETPKPQFLILQQMIESVSLAGYLALGALSAALLLGLSHRRRVRTRQQALFKATSKATSTSRTLPSLNHTLLLERMKSAMQLAHQVSTVSIYEAVKLRGGNGLASPSFEIPSAFWGLFSWQYVEEGTEVLIIDGKVVHQTDPIVRLSGLLGRRMLGRRVLLRPAPLIDIAATALSADQLSVTLMVSVQYTVADPHHVATLERPIDILQQRIIGAIAEYVRVHTLIDIVRDDGALRAELRERLNAAASIRSIFSIIEVLKALPKGDERLIELTRQTRLAEMKQPLILLENQNKAAAAFGDHQIAQLQAQLDEQRRAAEHQRTLQKQQAELDALRFQSMAASLGLTASAGTDPTKLAEVFLSLMQPHTTAPTTETVITTPLTPNELPAPQRMEDVPSAGETGKNV